jgi:signal transduction histidine kinase
VLALVFLAWMQVDLWGHAPLALRVTGGRGVLAALLVLVTLPLAIRRRAPASALLVAAGALAIGSVLVRDSAGGVPVEVFIAMLIAFYSVGAHCDELRARLVGALALAVIAAADLARPGFFNGGHSPRPAAWLAFAIAWLVGRDMRRRRGRVADLESRAQQLEREREERAQLAVSEERARIARELHDIVAHAMSVIVLQVGAVRHKLPAELEQDRDALQEVERTGRAALAEMRRLLGAMRGEADELELSPQPGLGSLEPLLEEIRRAGLSVELHVEGDPVQLPHAIDLSAYRIVQEGLTNALKHAHADRADIVVRYRPDELQIDVRDDGHGPSNTDGLGHGLVGIRERVKLYGGQMSAGADNGRGFILSTRLPLVGVRE